MFFFFFFKDHADELRSVAESTNVKAIIESEEYYFQKALDKFDEYKKLDVEKEILDSLVCETEVKPFSYEKLLSNTINAPIRPWDTWNASGE